ncbi:hypothetical protein LSH36_952g00026 [Paralvinella palmiformis]|uniref:Uncharacterized protein n=1 Tax=Paralvinella palmiformis TaxID=53620 RepID=A0AAD9MQQ3_9ANNE|nr:hypothetical protein LSH36_952g00026 [Paralvinella palmiformis]
MRNDGAKRKRVKMLGTILSSQSEQRNRAISVRSLLKLAFVDLVIDLGLEFDDREIYQHFVEFYNDVLPEFKAIGHVIQFKVCCNYEPHLRGNVYVQFVRSFPPEEVPQGQGVQLSARFS